MNVLFLNSAREWGGNEHWTYMAANVLSDEDHVFLAYRKDKVGMRFLIEKFKLPFLNEVDLYTVLKLVLLIRARGIDVLIPTKRKDYVIAGITAKLAGIKNVLRLGTVRKLNNTLFNYLTYKKLCNGIIVNAENIKSTLLQAGYMKNQQIEVIYNGVDTDRIWQLAKKSIDFNSTYKFYIVSVGELSSRKGYEFLLHGFARFLKVNNLFSDCGLILVGSGPEEEKLKQLAEELEIKRNIIFQGFKENPYPVMRKGNVFVSSSRNEGISNALIEAMFLGIPIISTRVGGVGEFIRNGENGFLIEQGNVAKLAEKLTDLYHNPEKRNRISKNAKQTVNDQFSLIEMKNQLRGFLTQILDSN